MSIWARTGSVVIEVDCSAGGLRDRRLRLHGSAAIVGRTRACGPHRLIAAQANLHLAGRDDLPGRDRRPPLDRGRTDLPGRGAALPAR
ncbi:hypothetical protein [Kribbella sancticallisti]|uniref:hypothetical protein n=1 Tax=Kribbella sancticallisti TaxID=460087 RepID=UPI0031D6CB9F